MTTLSSPPSIIASQADVDFARACQDDLEVDPAALGYLWIRRGITARIARAFGLGVVDLRREGQNITGATWTLPILSPVEPHPIVGIKFHGDPARGPKNWWRPKGVSSRQMFPLVKDALALLGGDEIIVTEGELKALAFISAGIPAVGPTCGAGTAWDATMGEQFARLRVIMDPDREDGKAAADFIQNATDALQDVAESIEVSA
jgi:hypothetical protein